MKTRLLIYLAAFTVAALIIFFFTKAYYRVAGYSNLSYSAYDSYTGFQNLSLDINKALLINPDLIKAPHSSDQAAPIYINKVFILRQVNFLKSIIKDSTSIAILKELDMKLAGLYTAERDSGIYNKPDQQVSRLVEINSLVDQGISRSSFLLGLAKNQLKTALLEIMVWMAFCFIPVIILLVFAMSYIARQKLKVKRQAGDLELSDRSLKNAQSVAKIGHWSYNILNDRINWSDEVYKIWGLPKDTPVTYQTLLASIHPEFQELFRAEQLAAFAETKESNFDYQIIMPDTTLKWIHQQGRITSYFNKQARVFEATVRDITKQKELDIGLTENAIQQSLLAALVKSSDDAIISKTLAGIITSWNKGAEAIFGYTAKEAIGSHISLIIPSVQLDEEAKIVAKISAGEFVEHYETERIKKDGSLINVSLSVSPVRDSKGNIIGASKIARDITVEKRFREQILQNEIKYGALFENSLDAILLTLQSGEVLAANPAACTIFEMTEAEICSVGRSGLMDPTDPRLPAFLEERNRTGKAKGEFTFLRKGGKTFQGEQTSSVFTDSTGLAKACVILRDITARKSAEEGLEKSEKRFRALLENNNDIICLIDASFKLFYRSPSAVRITGWTDEEMQNVDARTNIHPEDLESAADIIKDMFANPGVPVNTLFRNLHKDGHYIWVEGVLNNLLHDKNVNAIVFNFRDVTERVKAETGLAESEKRFRALIENDEGIIAMLDENMLPVYRSPSAQRVTGYQDADRKNDNMIYEVHPDDVGYMKQRFAEMRQMPKTPIFCSYRIRHKEGHYIWLEGTFTNLLNDPGIRSVVVNIREVTKRKQAEEMLRASELHYRSLIEHANDAIYMANDSLQYIDINPSGTKMLGYSKEEFIQLTPENLVAEEDLEKNLPKLEELRSGKAITVEQKFIKKDGGKINVEVNATKMEDGSFIMIARDITARKNEELKKRLLAEISNVFNEPADLNQVLNLTTERLVSFGDFAMAEIWLVGKEQKQINFIARYPLTDSMLAFKEGTGCIKSFLKGQGLPGISWQKKAVQFWQNLADHADFLRGDAAEKAGIYAAYGLPLLFNNEVLGVLTLGLQKNKKLVDSNLTASFENLGQHMGAEIKRKQLEQELSQLFNFAPDIICIAGVDGYFKKINPAAADLLEYTEEELLGLPYMEFIHPDDRTETIKKFEGMTGGNSSSYVENRCITKSGKIKWFAWTSNLSPEEGLIFSVAKDITRKKELENLLSKVNTLARVGGWEVDLLSSTVYWTDIVREIHEVDAGYMPDLKSALNFYKDDTTRDFIGEKVRRSIEYGNPWDEELQIITGKGNERWIRTIGETEFIKGKCIRIYGSFQDIDHRKRAEIGLQKTVKALEDYKFALDQSSIISITERNGEISHVNDNLTQISKYAKEELVGQTHHIFHSGYHPENFFNELWRTIESGKVWRNEIKNKAKDGSYYWVDTTIVPFLGTNNYPLQYLAIGFDITEKKVAIENEIRILGEKNTILESIGDAFFAVDRNWVVTYWNQVAERVLGKPKGEMLGQNLWQMFPNSTTSTSYKKYRGAMKTGQVVHFEDFYAMKDTWYEISAYPSDNGLSVYFKDITYRKLSEIRLKKLNDDLNEQAKQLAYSNKELEQFAYVASHDLQEPLRMITSFVTKLDQKYQDVFDDTGKKYIHFAVDGARRMRRIILDLLDFSRVGRSGEDLETFDLNEILKEIKVLFRKQIDEKKAIVDSALLPVVQGYRAPLQQVFHNLISNALKYSKDDIPPHVVINMKESSGYWEFSISDNGIGIEREYFDRIFVIFQRLHKKDEYSGTGMGLAITKKIVENLGGNIWLESTEGKGSTFYFTILKI